jgi:hypothetical protein
MKPQPPRTPSRLSDSVHHQLNMYAFAASAAGVGMLALTQAAEAKIVYTKAHHVIRPRGTYNLDLNHDGTVDFIIHQLGSVFFSHSLLAKEALGNAVQGKGTGWAMFASALNRGARIGPSQGFIKSGYDGEKMVAVTYDTYGGHTYVGGPWINVKNRYLGLQFQIRGKTHYGWARLSVRIGEFGNGHDVITATLTGYAYETVPNKPIIAGKTKGADGIEALELASLGRLAQGSAGLVAWRSGK